MTWIYENTELTEIPENAIGFVYCITNTATNRKYIGKKNFYFSKTKQVKGKKKKIKVVSDYKDYFGSNEEFDARVNSLGYDKNFYIWSSLLVLDYIEKLKIYLKNELPTENLLKWGKDNIDQFDIWELRELISMYWFCRNQGLFDIYNLQNEFPDVKFVSIDDIKHNFVDTITNCLNYFSKDTHCIELINAFKD